MGDSLPNRMIRPSCTLRLAFPSDDGSRPLVGDELVIQSRGRYRLARVEGVGRLNARMAYTTDGGHVTRKSVPYAELYAEGSAAEGRTTYVVREPEPSPYRRGRSGGHRLVEVG